MGVARPMSDPKTRVSSYGRHMRFQNARQATSPGPTASSRGRVRLAPRALALLAAGFAALGAFTGSAAATAVCPGVNQTTRFLGHEGTSIEGAVVDNQGRLYLADLFTGNILRIDAPGDQAKVIATLPGGSAGALALLPDGTVIAGAGADVRVFAGDALLPGRIWKIDPVTSALTELPGAFSAADGLAVAHDGTIYATNDFGGVVGRELPDGTFNSRWAIFPSANGAVLSSDDKYLYVSRSFVNPGVSRIPTNDPAHPQSLINFTGLDAFSIPDGLTLDSQNRPVVPTDISGEILRIDSPGHDCRLAHGLTESSVIVYGRGPTGFAAGHLYRTGFDAKLYEIDGGFDATAAAAAGAPGL
jgi:gluconolactonase